MTPIQPNASMEGLRESFLEEFGPDTDQMVSAHQEWMPNCVADWWLSRITAIIKEAEERKVKEIVSEIRSTPWTGNSEEDLFWFREKILDLPSLQSLTEPKG